MAGINCGKLDISKLSDEEIVAAGNFTWIKAEVDEKIYIWRNEPNIVIKFSDMCSQTVCEDHNNLIRSLLFTATGLKAQDNDSGNNVNKDNARNFQPQTVCGADVEWLKQAQNAVDSHSMNQMGYQPAAVMPSAAIVPMRSNVKMYGPYASSNFGNSSGGTSVAVDADLCPWVFGSTEAMNSAGSSIVESSAIGLTRAETGGVTIPGLPDLASLGATAGASGPNLTNINFTFGSGGVTTSYEFKTYTPKFGSLNRHFIDKFKDIAKNRQEQLKFLRSAQIVQNKIGRKIQNAKRQPVVENKLPGTNREASLQRVLVAEMYDWDGSQNNQSQRTVVGTNTLSKSVNEMTYEYDKKAYMSWDGLIGPVSLKGAGGLPRYATFNPQGHKSSPISPQPPFSVSGDCSDKDLIHEQYNLEITQQYNNPLTNSFDFDEHHHNGPGAGHAIDILGKGDQVPNSGIIINMYRPDDNDKYADDYRFIAMRGPIVLHSWGYDLDGKPVPNASDAEEAAKQGTFKNTYLKDEFLQDWLKKPSTWPAAPIDLRFDRDRGLWVSPQSYKIVVAKITDTVKCYSEGKGVIIPYGKQLFDKEGSKVNPQYGNDKACGDGISKKEYEWILVNIGPCELKWYCCTDGTDELGNPQFICRRSDDPLFCGVDNIVSGPYDTEAECPCSISPPTPTPTPLTTTVITGVTLGSEGLVFTTAVIEILGIISTGSISIATTNCDSSSSSSVEPTPTPTSTPTPTPTPTATNTPTPTPTSTSTPTPTPSPSSSSSSSGDEPEREAPVMINIVDRLGKTHKIGELVYAYFDTSTEKYIVLQRHPEPITPTVYGTYSGIDNTEGVLVVDYAAGVNYCEEGIVKGSEIFVKNKLNLPADCSAPAIAIKMEKLVSGE
jgi:hypothetical protein